MKAVDWLTAQLPRDAQYQIYAFDTEARPVAGRARTARGWRPRTRRRSTRRSRRCARRRPQGGTSLHAAFAAADAMNPPPDNIILLTDGLPTQGARPATRKTVSGRERLRLFDDALDALPRGVPVNILLFPMEGDPHGR